MLDARIVTRLHVVDALRGLGSGVEVFAGILDLRVNLNVIGKRLAQIVRASLVFALHVFQGVGRFQRGDFIERLGGVARGNAHRSNILLRGGVAEIRKRARGFLADGIHRRHVLAIHLGRRFLLLRIGARAARKGRHGQTQGTRNRGDFHELPSVGTEVIEHQVKPFFS